MTPSNSDLSVQLLNKLFGAGWQNFAGNSGGFFQQILSLYDTTLFAVLGIIAVYSLLMGIAEASHDGVPLGKRYSKWMPVRIVAASAFLAPVPPAGISIVQSVILWLIGMSVGFADNVWTASATYLIKGGPAVIVNANTGTELAKDAMQSLVCQNFVNSEYYYIGQGTQYNGTDPMNPNSPPQILAPMPGQYVQEQQQTSTFTVANPQTTGYGSNYFGAPPGGTSTQNIIDQIGFNGAANSGLGPGVCGVFTFSYADNTPAASSVASAQSSALTQMLATLAPLAVQIVNAPGTGVVTTSASATPQLPNPQPLYTAINNYQNAISSAAASAASQGSNASVLQTWLSTATSGGWMSAGSFFYSFAKQNQRLSELVSKKWSYAGPAMDSLAEPSNGTYGLKNVLASTASYTKLLDSTANFVGNPPTSGQLADASGSVSTGSSTWGKLLSLLSSPMTGIVNGFAQLSLENGDPMLTVQSYGFDIIEGVEAALVLEASYLAATHASKSAIKGASHLPVIGGVIGAIGGVATGASTGVEKLLVPLSLAILLPILAEGAILAYVFPALPFVFWTYGIVMWVFLVFESLLAAPIWGIFHAQPEGEGFLPSQVSPGYIRMLDLFLRPVLMVSGLFVAFQMSEVIAFFVEQGFTSMVTGLTGGSLTGIVGIFMLVFILVFLVIQSMKRIYELSIIALPERIMRWFGGGFDHQGAPNIYDEGQRGVSTGTRAIETGVGTWAAMRAEYKRENKRQSMTQGNNRPEE